MLVQKITLGTLVRLCWYRRVLQEHWWECAGTAEYYRSTRETVLVLHSTIGALGRVFWYTWEEMLVQSTIETLGRLCWYNRVQLEHLEGCVGTVEYYRKTRAVLLVQKSFTGELGRLCWYQWVCLALGGGGCIGKEYYRSIREAVPVLKSTLSFYFSRALWRLYLYSSTLWEHLRGCAATLVPLVHENWGGCVGTVVYYKSTGEAVLVQ